MSAAVPGTAGPESAADPECAAEIAAHGNASDARLTASVTSALRRSGAVRGAEIDVAVRDGLVTLSGRVWDEHERAQAVVVTEGVAGVVTVRDDLQVIPPPET